MDNSSSLRLTRAFVVAEAISILDAEGEAGLTFRALATRLRTGHGAIQWHVTTKAALVDAAAEQIIQQALSTGAPVSMSPREAVIAVAGDIFDAVDGHPWLVSQLARSPWPMGTMLLFERIGRHIQSLTPLPGVQFSATSALVHHIIGGSGQNAANTASARAQRGRDAILDATAAQWAQLDEAAFPFTRSITRQLRNHDDRSEFLAGVNLIIEGLLVKQA